MIGLDEQITTMAARWPTFTVVSREDRAAVWEGTLDPVKRRYRIRVALTLPYAIENVTTMQVQPRVQVLDPVLEWHPEFEEGPVPHVYRNDEERALPFLCLFDPYNGEWSLSDLLADTTVPWTARYLFFYEGWLATTKWHGGGRHLTDGEGTCGARAKSIAAV
ncbi:MAG TPA: hypothetical protein VHS33_02670 [Sphingomicrobium sp.]|nr:hypothetical protein [Sphingomicrobium sp.]